MTPKKSYNMMTGLSDHNMVLISRKLTSKQFTTHASNNKEFFGIPKNKQNEFKSVIGNMNWEDLVSSNIDLELSSQIFTEKIQSTISEFSIKMKHKYKKQSLPWVNDNIKKIMKERDNALKLATRSKMVHDRNKFVMLRNKVVRALRKAKADFFITIIENAHGNSKIIWRQIKKLSGQKNIKTSPTELKINDTLLQSQIDVAQALKPKVLLYNNLIYKQLMQVTQL